MSASGASDPRRTGAIMEPRVGHWVRLIRPAPEQGYSGDHLRETWQRRRDEPSLVIHVTDTDVYCVEPLSKPERNAHEFWSAPFADVELVADPHEVDTQSPASRQHYIDTGVYLDAGEAVTTS